MSVARVATPRGGRRWYHLLAPLLLLAAGGLVTLSLAPFNLWPAGIAAMVLLCHGLLHASPRQAAWRGWLFGFGLWGSGASWVYVSIHVYGYAPVPLAATLTILFCAGLALLFQTSFAWVYVRWVRDLPGGVLFGFPLTWVVFEWVRSWLLTGFPWLYLGYAHLDTALAGWAPVAGVYSLSLIIALCGSWLVVVLYRVFQRRLPQPRAGAAAPSTLLATAALIALLWGAGAALQSVTWVKPTTNDKTAKALTVSMYQPNIPQELKWNRAYLPGILAQYERAVADLGKFDIVVWPESAIPRYFQDIGPWLRPLAARAEATNSALISGIPYRSEGRNFNSVVVLGQGSGVYHKQRLVPFGEYVPMEQWLRGLIAFFDLPMSQFSRGPAGQAPLAARGARLAPYICYEVVYPDLVASTAREADILITISNDSWFGHSIGPLQHLQMAQMRALENGRYLIRGTNNGVSAIINPRGQVVTASKQFVETTLTGTVVPMQGLTPFGRFGVMPLIGACFVLLGVMALLGRRRWH